MRDRLARIHERDTFLERAESEVRRAQRYGRTLTVLMLAVDSRSAIVKRYGRAWFDLLMDIIGLICRENLRDPDILGRHNEHVLAIVLPEAGEASGVQLAARLIAGLSAIRLPTANGELAFTVSAGVAATVGEVAELDHILSNAEDQLKAAQAAGGHQVKGCFVGDRREHLDEALARLGRRRTDPDEVTQAVELTREELDVLLRRRVE